MTHLKPLTGFGLTGLAFAFLGAPASAQVFTRNSSDVPSQGGGIQRYTENVDFADVDLDGDWDAAFSHGGDLGDLQDRLWINQGGDQGGTIGKFLDRTSTQFPTVARDGRDIEFVDFDNDGDVDIYVSNTSTNSNQGNQWFENQGGLMGGTVGFFVDDTAARWIGLGVPGTPMEPGSSIAASQLIGGSFIDWSCDCDFGDLDNDGDLDLVHSTYGGSFGGNVPTRMFLNNGAGFFKEFNPSNHQLTGSNIANGAPGLWCEGVQTPNTSNTTGTNCDITTNTLDIDLGDIDGDFDLDLLHGDRTQRTRFFYNRLEENGGTLGFRDVTNLVYPSNWSNGEGHYEQELGDFDGDNDLDLYGLNWQAAIGFTDCIMTNVGGTFGPFTNLPGSSTDDNEGDFGDYDNDGDLDLHVSNFFGTDRLYRNNGSGGFTLLSSGASGFNGSGIGVSALDGDWCDVDFDGDYDIFSAQDGTRPVLFWENQNGTPDTTAARVAPTENIGNQTATIDGPDFPARTHVYDNASYYVTWYNDTNLIVEVDGIQIDSISARSSGGQVFRGELPSNLVGNVTYRFESTDEYGNTGVSADQNYVATTGLTLENTYGTGTVGSAGALHEIHVRGLATSNKNLYLTTETNGTPTIFVTLISTASVAPTFITDVGIINVDPFNLVLQKLAVTNSAGTHVRKIPVSNTVPGGFSVFAQVLGFDGVGGLLYSTSEGLEIPFH